MKTIYLETNYLTLSKLNEFNMLLYSNLAENRLCIDLNGIGFCDPQTILCLAVMLRDFDMRRGTLHTDISILPNNNVIGYLAHIGFFDFIGANFGNKVGDISVGESYIPIRAINKIELLRESTETGKSLQDLIQEEASYLARILVGSN